MSSFHQQKIYIAGINSGEIESHKGNSILDDHNFIVELA